MIKFLLTIIVTTLIINTSTCPPSLEFYKNWELRDFNKERIEKILVVIRRNESGSVTGNYNIPGKSDEYGAYQFQRRTYNHLSKKFFNEVLDMSKENQDKVAFAYVDSLLNKCKYNEVQIASVWNCNKPNWEGKVGINDYGVRYDVPAYVANFIKRYNKIHGVGCLS